MSDAHDRRESTPEPGEWYWDWRHDKAYYACQCDDRTVRLLTVWHRDELESALATGAVTPLDELDERGRTFDLKASFRLPDDVELPAAEEES